MVDGGSDVPGWTMEAYKLEGPKEEDSVLVGVEPPEEARMQQREQLQVWERPRTLNLESSKYLKWTHL